MSMDGNFGVFILRCVTSISETENASPLWRRGFSLTSCELFTLQIPPPSLPRVVVWPMLS